SFSREQQEGQVKDKVRWERQSFRTAGNHAAAAHGVAGHILDAQ
ncbi:9074_t:CDS:2, partial [Funneliformis geosporum]